MELVQTIDSNYEFVDYYRCDDHGYVGSKACPSCIAEHHIEEALVGLL